jgi:hypothetical protein
MMTAASMTAAAKFLAVPGTVIKATTTPSIGEWYPVLALPLIRLNFRLALVGQAKVASMCCVEGVRRAIGQT